MEDKLKLNIGALARNDRMSVRDLAIKAEIDPTHLVNVTLGRATFTAIDLYRLVKTTGVSIDNIDVENP